MNIIYLKQSEIDKTKWDSAVKSNFITASPFALSWYLDASCDNWDALVLDDYVSVMPLPYRKKWHKYYIYPPYFLPRLGVFGKTISENEFQTWLNAIPNKFSFIDIVLHENMQLDKEKWTSTTHNTYIVDCRLSYEEIRKKYSQNHKRNCLKASNENLKIVNDFAYEKAIAFFRNYQAKHYKSNYQEKDYVRLIRILNLLNEKQQLKTYGVVDANNKLCAAAFFPFINEKYYFLFSGRKNDDNKSMFFLIDSFIQQHAAQKCLLDFNGSNRASLAKFYAGFGANAITFKQISLSRLNIISKCLFYLYRKINY